MIILLVGLYVGRGTFIASSGSLVASASAIALLAVSVVAADALWRRSPRALAGYGVWSAGYLANGAIVQSLAKRVPIAEVGIWVVCVGAVLVALGVYVRDRLRHAPGDAHFVA